MNDSRSAERQVPIATVCRGVRFEEGFRADIMVESKVIIEMKSVERITHTPQEGASDLSEAHPHEARLPAEIRPGHDEAWHHSHDQRPARMK